MTGWATIEKIRKFEERAAELGFVVREPDIRSFQHTGTYNSVWIDEVSTDQISLSPAEGRYPGWGRGSVFTGSIEEAVLFLQGLEFAHISDNSIGLTSYKKRAQAEAKYVERMRKLEAARQKKAEQKKMWDLLKHGADEGVDAVPF